MFKRFTANTDIISDIYQVESLVRQRFDIDPKEIILVTQDQGVKPGFPRDETNVVFWKNETRYRLKIFLPVKRVQSSDLPAVWLLPSLEDTGDGDCC